MNLVLMGMNYVKKTFPSGLTFTFFGFYRSGLLLSKLKHEKQNLIPTLIFQISAEFFWMFFLVGYPVIPVYSRFSSGTNMTNMGEGESFHISHIAWATGSLEPLTWCLIGSLWGFPKMVVPPNHPCL